MIGEKTGCCAGTSAARAFNVRRVASAIERRGKYVVYAGAIAPKRDVALGGFPVRMVSEFVWKQNIETARMTGIDIIRKPQYRHVC